MQFAQRGAGAAAGIENRDWLHSDEAKAFGHALSDLPLQHGSFVIRGRGALEGAAHLCAIEVHGSGRALSGHHRALLASLLLICHSQKRPRLR